MEIAAEELKLLRYMLGATKYQKSDWGWRNYFFANRADENYALMKNLNSKGLVIQSLHAKDCFHATEKGCNLVGVTEGRMNQLFQTKSLTKDSEQSSPETKLKSHRL